MISVHAYHLILSFKRGRLKQPEIKAIYESYMAAMHLAFIDGKTVTTPLIKVNESGLEPGPALQRAAQDIEVKKVE